MTVAEYQEFISGKRVLLQYSGGKDSTACLLALHNCGVSFEAIHFTHSYCYRLPSEVAEKICGQFGIKLTIIDMSERLEELLTSDFSLRPCRFCKAIMDELTVQFAEENGFEVICVGDTADDKTLIERIKNEGWKDLVFNKYFNKQVHIPNGISILRPMIFENGEKILDYVCKECPSFRRVNDTGDKYFDYSREGCPLQFKDIGAPYTKTLMAELLQANTICAEFATQKGIRASVHLPSGCIVTIPRGFETKCEEYLRMNGFNLPTKKTMRTGQHYLCSVAVMTNECQRDKSSMVYTLSRLLERMGFSDEFVIGDGIQFRSEGAERVMSASFMGTEGELSIRLYSAIKPDIDFVDNLMVELFHTQDYSIQIDER